METKSISTSVFTKLQYKSAGDGPVIVLLHGFPVSGDVWYKMWDDLAQSFKVIIPDFPGSGGSSGIDGLSMPLMAEAVKEILDNENIAKAVIAGHSMGGYVAMEMAYQFPYLIQGIAMVHSVASADTEEKKDGRRKAIALIEKGGREQFISR